MHSFQTLRTLLRAVAGRALLAFGLTLGMSACSGVAVHALSSQRTWTEEIQLHDGSMITARRTYVLGGRSEPGARESSSTFQTVTFNTPAGEIEWTTDFRDSQPEPNSLSLIAFDIVKGIPYIATRPAGCIAYNKWQRPNPPQIFFKYVDKQWVRVALAEFPSEITQANVVLGRPSTEILKPFYSVADVRRENSDVKVPQYRTILREAMTEEQINSSCQETFSNGKGRALSANWFKLSKGIAECRKTCQVYEYDSNSCPCSKFFKEE